jgi:hypothetical protein
MARDYGKLLKAAEQMNPRGYLDADDVKQREKAKGRFKIEVRNLVYALYRESPDHGSLSWSVTANLSRLAATGAYSEAAIADARAALLAEIEKRSHNSSATRFAIRWVLPAFGLAAAVVLKVGLFK